MRVLGHRLTHPIKCRDCGEPGWFHTNGYGDVVIFDHLGPPWPLHRCYEARVAGKVVRDRTEYRAHMIRLYGASFTPKPKAKQVSWSSVATVTKRRAAPAAKDLFRRPIDIARCEPENFPGRTIEVTGFVHDLHMGWSLDRLATAGSIGYAAYRRLIGSDRYSQLTIIDSDLLSYTFIVGDGKLDLGKGAIVSAEIKSIRVAMDAFFVCCRLGAVKFNAN